MTVETDEIGNLYITKGQADSYPCVAAHLDEIHVPCVREVVVEGDKVFTVNRLWNRVGCGADDKNGLWVIINLLHTEPVLKVAMFVQEERDGGDNLSGAAHVILDTLRALARTPDLDCFFEEIHCTGDPVNGFRFGQVVWNDASTVDGIGPNGPGAGLGYEPLEDLEMCECWVEFIEGRWRISKEASIRSNQAYARVLN